MTPSAREHLLPALQAANGLLYRVGLSLGAEEFYFRFEPAEEAEANHARLALPARLELVQADEPEAMEVGLFITRHASGSWDVRKMVVAPNKKLVAVLMVNRPLLAEAVMAVVERLVRMRLEAAWQRFEDDAAPHGIETGLGRRDPR